MILQLCHQSFMPKPFIINKLTNISLHFLCNITSAFYFLLFVNLKKVLYNICIYIRDTHLHFTYASPNRHILCTFPVKIQIKENTMQLTQRAENIIKFSPVFHRTILSPSALFQKNWASATVPYSASCPRWKNGWERRDTVLCANEVWD